MSIGMRSPEIQQRFEVLERLERRMRDLEIAAARLQPVFGGLREVRERRRSNKDRATISGAASLDRRLPEREATQVTNGELAESAQCAAAARSEACDARPSEVTSEWCPAGPSSDGTVLPSRSAAGNVVHVSASDVASCRGPSAHPSQFGRQVAAAEVAVCAVRCPRRGQKRGHECTVRRAVTAKRGVTGGKPLGRSRSACGGGRCPEGAALEQHISMDICCELWWIAVPPEASWIVG